MLFGMPDLLDLEIEFRRGGWSAETQQRVLEALRGRPQRFYHPENDPASRWR